MSVSDLNKRRNKILAAIIESYIKTAKQVSSRYISKMYDFDLSPATIRNEMSELEDMGYLTHPHTSAGRVPTDEGYRFYVNELMDVQELSIKEISQINKNFELKFKVVENVIEITNNLLSKLSHQTSLILYPKLDKSSFKHVELIHLKHKKVLIVLMTNSGMVKNSIVELKEEDITSAQLKKISNFLNYELYGMPLGDVRNHLESRMLQEKDILYRLFKDTIGIFKRIFENIHEDKLALEGIDHILDNPEFEDLKKSRLIFKMLGQRKLLTNFLRKDLNQESVHLTIGKEFPVESVNDCSVVTACYKISNQTIGCLGILGPKRMQYGRMVALVKYVSKCISDALTDLEK